jgi:Tol biopolymer transport system component
MTRLLVWLFCLSMLSAANATFAQSCGAYPTTITTLKERGGRVDWSRAHGLIAYDDDRNADGYFDVRVMSRDGGVDYCLTCWAPEQAPPGLKKNKGQPAWHPSGNYLVFQAEFDGSTAGPKASNPGRGVNNVLWLADRNGTEFHQLTLPSTLTPATGVLHPHFSEDGEMLSWSEMYEPSAIGRTGKAAGYWRLVTAKFVTGNGPPRLESTTRHLPMAEGFYENHGFSPDGRRLIFSSNAARNGYLDRLNNDIFTLDLASGAVTPLTNTRYNEHASYFPSGAKILWMSNRENSGRGTDLWIMDPDGEKKERLTSMNQRGCPEATPNRAVAADSSINATGDAIVVYVQDELLGDVGSILLVELAFPF